MNDVKYSFIETQRERKSNSRSARYKKNGSKSKRCSLPHDSYTAKQLRERNGEMITYNINKPMSWREFKLMPDDLRKEYLLKLKREFDARGMDLANMFGVDRGTVSKEIHRLCISEYAESYGKQPSEKWLRFIGASEEPQESVEAPTVDLPSEESNAAEAKDSEVKQEQEVLRLTNGQLFFVGEPAAIFEKMMLVLDRSVTYNMAIGFFETKKEG